MVYLLPKAKKIKAVRHHCVKAVCLVVVNQMVRLKHKVKTKKDAQLLQQRQKHRKQQLPLNQRKAKNQNLKTDFNQKQRQQKSQDAHREVVHHALMNHLVVVEMALHQLMDPILKVVAWNHHLVAVQITLKQLEVQFYLLFTTF